MTRLNGTASQQKEIVNCQGLSDIEEDALSRWALDMYQCGLPLQLSSVRHLARLVLLSQA